MIGEENVFLTAVLLRYLTQYSSTPYKAQLDASLLCTKPNISAAPVSVRPRSPNKYSILCHVMYGQPCTKPWPTSNHCIGKICWTIGTKVLTVETKQNRAKCYDVSKKHCSSNMPIVVQLYEGNIWNMMRSIKTCVRMLHRKCENQDNMWATC